MKLEQLNELVKLGHTYEEAIEIMLALGKVSSGGIQPLHVALIGFIICAFVALLFMAAYR